VKGQGKGKGEGKGEGKGRGTSFIGAVISTVAVGVVEEKRAENWRHTED
jgi:hypothetical protein